MHHFELYNEFLTQMEEGLYESINISQEKEEVLWDNKQLHHLNLPECHEYLKGTSYGHSDLHSEVHTDVHSKVHSGHSKLHSGHAGSAGLSLNAGHSMNPLLIPSNPAKLTPTNELPGVFKHNKLSGLIHSNIDDLENVETIHSGIHPSMFHIHDSDPEDEEDDNPVMPGLFPRMTRNDFMTELPLNPSYVTRA